MQDCGKVDELLAGELFGSLREVFVEAGGLYALFELCYVWREGVAECFASLSE